jgi:hypothetical protein
MYVTFIPFPPLVANAGYHVVVSYIPVNSKINGVRIWGSTLQSGVKQLVVEVEEASPWNYIRCFRMEGNI